MNQRFIVCLFVVLFAFCGLKAQNAPDIYEIPSGYRGIVTILTSEPCGKKMKKKAGRLIIKIPSDGILITRNENLRLPFSMDVAGQQSRYNPNVYYEIEKKKGRTELPELDEKRFEQGLEIKYSKDDIGVFHRGFSSGKESQPEGISFSFYTLFIGSYNDLKSDKYNFELMFPTRAIEKLRKCRGE